jgi:hypothetical protein
VPSNFSFGELRSNPNTPPFDIPIMPLGPLEMFVGDFAGNGFNTIFRPDSAVTPTVLPRKPPPTPPHDNILELNLTSETLSFSKSLGTVRNRGTDTQPDTFSNGIPYVQQINDITIHGESTPIHFEPGLWMHFPSTTVPPLGETLVRMALIPQGVTIQAQGLVGYAQRGRPNIPAVDITPFITSNPSKKITFPSQTAANADTLRIPQDLAPFSSRITQRMLDDPNSLLRDHIEKQKILLTTTIFISTNPALPLFGGGIDNIAFLLGQPATPPPSPNANAVQMTAVFWIEEVEEVLQIPPYLAGSPPLFFKAKASIPGQRVATFSVTPPNDIEIPGIYLTVTFTQIQYTQNVTLNFKGMSWPHVSVNTLVPADPIEILPTSPFWKTSSTQTVAQQKQAATTARRRRRI